MRQNKLIHILCAIFTASTVISPVYAEGEETKENTTITIHYEVETIKSEDETTITPGSVDPSEVTINVTDTEGVIEAPTVTANEGYTFIGWKQDNESISSLPTKVSELSEDIINAGSVTYTAVFSVKGSIEKEKATNNNTNKIMLTDLDDGTDTQSNEDNISYGIKPNGDGTCAISAIKGTTTSSKLEIPSTVEVDGVTYRVTDISLSQFASPNFDTVTEIVFPTENLEKISAGYFGQFPNLTSITIPGNVKTFKGHFQNCKNIESITFEEGVEEIRGGESLVSGLSKLTTINLPATLKTLEGNFSNAEVLTTITLPGGIDISDAQYLFSGCTSLETVVLPSSVTSIPFYAFEGCTSLKSVTANGIITKISGSAFSGCTYLEQIPDLSHVTEMGSYAFYDCESLKSNADLSSLTEIPEGAFEYTYITVTKLSDKLTTIGDYAFVWANIAGNTDENTLTFPDTLTSIGTFTFYAGSMPEKVVLPDGLTNLGYGALQSVRGVNEVDVGASLTEIESYALSVKNENVTIVIDNSKDEISGYVNLPSSATVVYNYESIDTDDTIDESGMTLQEAINASNKVDTIVIKKNVQVTNGLNVPSNKDITITSEEGKTYTIVAKSKDSVEDLFTVEEGANITFKNIKLSGHYNNDSVIETKGNVTISDDTTVFGSAITKSDSGVINVSGKNASLTIAGGSIERNTLGVTSQDSGTVRVSNGATVLVTGGEIKNNKSLNMDSANTSSGILLYGNASGSMTGGAISDNTTRRGSAILLNGVDNSNRTSFILNGGEIKNNTCTNGSSDISTSAGAIYIRNNAEFTMNDGTITGNTGGDGAGVCVTDFHNDDKSGKYNTAFVMNDGKISNNTASRAGGGIYSYSNGVLINGGKIINNSANMGGGIYSEGNATEGYGTIQINNTYVSENTAEQGGGLWFCPTGEGQVFSLQGATIYQNTATGAGDDVVSAIDEGKGRFGSLSLSNKTISGGYVTWHEDGGVTMKGTFGGDDRLPTVSKIANRYNDDSNAIVVDNVQKDIALKAIYGSGKVDDTNAKVIITGNEATYGGGIAANGGVIIGEDVDKGNLELSKEMVKDETTTDKFTFEITLTDENGTPVSGAYKAYYNDSKEASTIVFKNGKVTVELGQNEKIKIIDIEKNVTYKVIEKEKDGYTVDKISIGDTSYTFTKKDKEGYSIKETMVDGKLFVTKKENEENVENPQVIQKDTTSSIKFTNKKCTSLTVKKVWKLDDGGKKAEYVIVDLLKNDVVDQTVTLSDKNNWTYTWNTLDVSSTYTVQERTVDGFTTTIIKQDNTFTITNDDKPKPSTPTPTSNTPTTYKLVKTDAK